MKVYIINVALKNKQNFYVLISTIRWFYYMRNYGSKFPTRSSLCSPYAADELRQTYK